MDNKDIWMKIEKSEQRLVKNDDEIKLGASQIRWPSDLACTHEFSFQIFKEIIGTGK